MVYYKWGGWHYAETSIHKLMTCNIKHLYCYSYKGWNKNLLKKKNTHKTLLVLFLKRFHEKQYFDGSLKIQSDIWNRFNNLCGIHNDYCSQTWHLSNAFDHAYHLAILHNELHGQLYTLQSVTQFTSFWVFPQMGFPICHVLFDQSVNSL